MLWTSMCTGLFMDSMSVVSHHHFAVIKLSNQNQSQKQPLLILLLPLTEKQSLWMIIIIA